MYNKINNPSNSHTMLATLTIPITLTELDVRTIVVEPNGSFPVVGRIEWHRWTFNWQDPAVTLHTAETRGK